MEWLQKSKETFYDYESEFAIEFLNQCLFDAEIGVMHGIYFRNFKVVFFNEEGTQKKVMDNLLKTAIENFKKKSSRDLGIDLLYFSTLKWGKLDLVKEAMLLVAEKEVLTTTEYTYICLAMDSYSINLKSKNVFSLNPDAQGTKLLTKS